MTGRNFGMMRFAALCGLAIGSALLVACAPLADAAPAPDRGRALFTRCIACHALDPAARFQTGPHLRGIVGRPAASLPGFAYGPALRSQNFVWTEQRLDRWLRQPQDGFPGLCLPFTGLPRQQDRTDLIAWLKTQAD